MHIKNTNQKHIYGEDLNKILNALIIYIYILCRNMHVRDEFNDIMYKIYYIVYVGTYLS